MMPLKEEKVTAFPRKYSRVEKAFTADCKKAPTPTPESELYAAAKRAVPQRHKCI
jgi:hypothetical protein